MDDARTPSDAEAASHGYQSHFPEVEALSSRELLRETFPSRDATSAAATSDGAGNVEWRVRGRSALLVDVRTEPERDASMISGAVSLDEFRESVLPRLRRGDGASAAAEGGSVDPRDNRVVRESVGSIVMYCTIGYRSGMEAQKLRDDHPTLFERFKSDIEDDVGGQIALYNLDGILPFANAAALLESPGIDSEGYVVPTALLVDATTGRLTSRVHVYGPSWKKYLSGSFEAVMFSKVEFGWRGIAVACRSCFPAMGCCRG